MKFNREMQRHLVAICQLFHFKGHLNPLKRNTLNEAVLDTAHEDGSSIVLSFVIALALATKYVLYALMDFMVVSLIYLTRGLKYGALTLFYVE